MLKRAPALLGVLLLGFLASPLSAQTVQGIVLDEHSGAPVAGALVVLLDRGGEQRVGRLSGADGRFLIPSLQPGSYRVRAERIGYAGVTSESFQLAAGEARELTLRIAPSAISLQGVDVVAAGRQRCTVRPEQGREAYAIWEEARKALASAAVTDAQSNFLYHQTTYEDVLDARGTQVTEMGQRRSARVRRPFHSLPLEQLIERGFVQQTDSGAVYYAPDASVLLSDDFLDHHCFRAAEPHPGEASLVGLAFEPVGRRAAAGISGTLWIDRRSSELRYLEFRYPSPHAGIPNTLLGGRVEFHPLPTGEWIVRRWWLRTPRVGQEASRTVSGQPVDRYVLIGLTEHGGEVQRISRPTGETVFVQEEMPIPHPLVQPALAQAPATPADATADGAAPAGASPAGPGLEASPPPAAARAPLPRRRDPARITRAEIEHRGAINLFELVQVERPQWLRSRGPQTLRTVITIGPRGEPIEAMVQTPVVVYVDGIRVGPLDSLRDIPTHRVAAVQFVDGRAATQRWGTEHSAGVILISSM